MKAETYSPFVVLIAIIFNEACCESSLKVFRKLSASFGATVWACRKEVTFPMDVIEEFLDFWKPNHVFLSPELGCVAMCALLKLELIDLDHRLIEKHAIGFAKANYADEKIAHQIVSYGQTCLRSIESNATVALKEPCAVGLALARCFQRAVLAHHQVPQLTDTYIDLYDYE